MGFFVVKPASCLKGTISLLGDKSIACRAVIISAISPTKTVVKNFPVNKDCFYAVKSFQKLGIKITRNLNMRNSINVFGGGLSGLRKPKGPIFVGDSGTTLRLLLGILANQNFKISLIAGKSLSKRPMLRVTTPLRMMGARIKSKIKVIPSKRDRLKYRKYSKIEEYPPLTIKGNNLKPISYKMPVASAQVKSAVLLAGLYTKGVTKVIERVKTRDHTERMLRLFKADIKVKQNEIVIKGGRELVSPGTVTIPGDISSASFFIVLAAMLPNSRILIKNVSLNPSRTGIIKVLKRMGADIVVSNRHSTASGFEPVGDLIAKSSELKGTIIKKEEIPSLIDELPLLMVAAGNAKGKSIFEGVSELRVKETDRIRSMSENLRKMGANIVVTKTNRAEKIIIQGVKEFKGSRVRSFGDHRTAMSMIVAGLKAKGKTLIDDVTCINKSFPEFLSILKKLIP